MSVPPDGSPAAFAGGLPCDVLIVEDDPLIALDLEDTLRRLGIRAVRTAGSVTLALDHVDDRRPDFALLNVNLGRENTFPVAERLEALKIPFVFLTGYGARSEFASQFAHRPRLSKPYIVEALEVALRRRGAP